MLRQRIYCRLLVIDTETCDDHNEDMPNKQGFLLVTVAVALMLLALVIGGVFLWILRTSSRTTQTASSGNRAFFSILEKNCENISTNGGIFYGLKLEELPFTVNQTVAPIKLLTHQAIACAGVNSHQRVGWVEWQTTDGATVDVFEPAALANPTLRLAQRGQSIQQAGGSTWFAALRAEPMAPRIPANYGVWLTVQKSLRLSGDELVDVQVTKQVIPAGDARLLAILNQIPMPSNTAITPWPAGETAVVRQIYRDPQHLRPEDAEQLTALEDIVNAVTPKHL